MSSSANHSVSLPFPTSLLPAKRRLRRDLRCSVGDGAAFGAMVGMGETYLPAFVLAVGLGELTAGLIGSVPLFIGGVLQIVSPWAIRKLGSHKAWVVLCSIMQALMFLPLIMAAMTGTLSTAAVLTIASLYWASGLAAGPAWNTWIGTLVPATIRPRFFAARTRISQACVFAGFMSAGLLLQWASDNDVLLTAYAVLFGVAAFCRLISALMLAGQSEPIPIPPLMTRQPLRRIFADVCKGPGGQLLMFLVAVQAAVQLSGPYFTPFMFNNLKLSYMEFMILIAAAFLFRIFSLPAWGQLASRVGAHRLLWIGAVGIVPVSFGWVISQNFYWLLAIQAYSGAAWAAYELAFFLLFFESIPEEKRTGMLTVYNLINVGAWVSGSLFGGLILYTMQTSFTSYLLIFGLSALGRVLALGLLARVPKIEVESQEIGMRTIAVRPNGANLDAPVLPSMPDQIPDSVTAQAS
ncbi:MFS transporter [Rubinisphaera margarita]|uniref:MFS transporter n=1 Tax=Rubinisphaera margarita TaxID=2909586 RepID=UPI001EE9147A|nr:MFS transporter [Rubinisphaera margarita]MCG6157468.1 MFS transporter [Rubinisphaera margarita]